MTSSEQLNRIVGLVSELTKKARQGSESTALDDLAQRFGATRSQIQSDIRALTLLGDDPDADWMLSLSVYQEGDRVSLSSGGPFQRPIRFTGEELVAIQLGLAATDAADNSLSIGLARVLQTAERVTHALAGRGRVVPSVNNLMREAINDRRKAELKYAGERSLGGVNRVIHPYQLLEQQGQTYVVAWCELAQGWRHFRADRVLDALLLDEHYAPRGDFVPAGDSFSEPPEGVTPVQVRFSPAIARWLRERYPAALPQSDGGVIVTYLVASPEWLVRHVLQYGAEAEVVAPASYRALMRQQLAS
jgi:predicted DNA-binding transcriptional regulator YafY